VPLPAKSRRGGLVRYPVVNDERSLLWMLECDPTAFTPTAVAARVAERGDLAEPLLRGGQSIAGRSLLARSSDPSGPPADDARGQPSDP